MKEDISRLNSLLSGALDAVLGELAGRTSNNRVVNFRGPSRLQGQIIDIKITQALAHSLRGEVLIEEVA